MNRDKIQINNTFIKLEDIQERLSDLKLGNCENSIYNFILNWFDNSDFILQQTSGSTGTPKEIKLKKSAMVASAKKTINYFNLNENDTVWLCLPIDYIAGKMMVVRALVGKLNLIFTSPKGTPKTPNQTVDFSAMVPLQIRNLITVKSDFSRIKTLIIGGAAIDYQLQELIRTLSTKIFATYGMTETCSHIALQRLNGKDPDLDFKVLDGITISTNSENRLRIEAGELSDNVIITNDIVELVSPTSFKLLGRVDNIINSGGIKISPEKLEVEISKIIGKECIIIPKKDGILGQKAVLILEGETKINQARLILNQLKKGLTKHHCPKAVYYIDSYPRTSSMKIDRNKVINDFNIK